MARSSNACSISATKHRLPTVASSKGRRPLIFVWGDSTAGALLPGLRKAQETNDFGIAQFTSSSCVPALNTDVAGVPNCRAINDKVLSLARELQPDIVLLHSTWDRYLDGVADDRDRAEAGDQGPRHRARFGAVVEARAAERSAALFHAASSPDPAALRSRRSQFVRRARLRDKLVPLGAEFISVWDTMCNADGCLTRIGDTAGDITASDQVHLTEKGSVFLVQSIIGTVLHGRNHANRRTVSLAQ